MGSGLNKTLVSSFVAVLAVFRGGIHTLLGETGCCRFQPTCSEYCRQAVQRFGLWRATSLAVARMLRCRPWGGSGFDPLPAK